MLVYQRVNVNVDFDTFWLPSTNRKKYTQWNSTAKDCWNLFIHIYPLVSLRVSGTVWCKSMQINYHSHSHFNSSTFIPESFAQLKVENIIPSKTGKTSPCSWSCFDDDDDDHHHHHHHKYCRMDKKTTHILLSLLPFPGWGWGAPFCSEPTPFSTKWLRYSLHPTKWSIYYYQNTDHQVTNIPCSLRSGLFICEASFLLLPKGECRRWLKSWVANGPTEQMDGSFGILRYSTQIPLGTNQKSHVTLNQNISWKTYSFHDSQCCFNVQPRNAVSWEWDCRTYSNLEASTLDSILWQ